MRKIDEIKMTEEIDLTENKVYYVKDGRLNVVDDLPYGFGKQTLTWQNGKVVHIDMAYSKKA